MILLAGSEWKFELEVVEEAGSRPLELSFYGHYLESTSADIERMKVSLLIWFLQYTDVQTPIPAG
jgi:hypothetical protein